MGGLLLILGVAVVSLGLVLSHTSECGPAPEVAEGAELIKAVQYRCYGSPDVLELADIEKPVPLEDEVLVQITAAAVNPLDWHYLRGSPFVMRLVTGLGKPSQTRLGRDFAGTIEAVGSKVTRFKVGDEVFGGANGAFAEYVTRRENGSMAIKPAKVEFAQAAAVPIAGVTALQALRDHGKLESGQHVLINGASGGVGTFAVQIAKSFGATVTGVCSARNKEMVRSIGADHVLDYRESNYTEGDTRYDLIVDMVGNHSLSANVGVLEPEGRLVIVGGPKGDWVGPLGNMLKQPIMSLFIDQEIIVMLAQLSSDDLNFLAELMQSGQLTPVIDRVFPLNEVPAAIAYSEEGHASGKIIIEVD